MVKNKNINIVISLWLKKRLLCVRIKWQPSEITLNTSAPFGMCNDRKQRRWLSCCCHCSVFYLFLCVCVHHSGFTLYAIKWSLLECTSAFYLMLSSPVLCNALCCSDSRLSRHFFWSNHIYGINTFKSVVAEVNYSLLHNIKWCVVPHFKRLQCLGMSGTHKIDFMVVFIFPYAHSGS